MQANGWAGTLFPIYFQIQGIQPWEPAAALRSGFHCVQLPLCNSGLEWPGNVLAILNHNVHTVRAALACAEPEFAMRAVLAVLGRNPTLHQMLDINELRANGSSRAAIIRDLLRIAADENRPAPEDWALALPRRIEVSALLAAAKPKQEFITEAYQVILQRTPSEAETAAQANALRWPATRSDFLAALASSAETESTGGEIVLVGLGRRRPSLRQFLKGRRAESKLRVARDRSGSRSLGETDGLLSIREQLAQILTATGTQTSHLQGLNARTDQLTEWSRLLAETDSSIRRLSESVAQILNDVSVQSEKLQVLSARTDQISALSRQVAGVETTVGRIRTRMETEGAKSAEIASDMRVMQELVRELAGHVADIQRALAALTSVPGSLQQMSGLTDSLASSIGGIAHSAAETAGIVRTLKEVPGEVQRIGNIAAGVAASVSRGETALAQIGARVLPPVMPGGDTVVTQVDGFFLGVPVREWRLSTYYHNRGPLEPGVYKFFQNIIRPGMTVVDVGANVGLYTLLAARLLQNAGLVFSFEPTPDVFRILRNNVQINGFAETGIVRLHNSAVADQSGVLALYTDMADSTHNSLFPLPSQTEEIQVPTVALDEALGETRPDLVKIDAEGSEPLVMRGMQQLIARNPEMRIVLEFAPEHIRRSGRDPEAFLDELRRPGFILRSIDEISGELTTVPDSTILSAANTNLLVSRL